MVALWTGFEDHVEGRFCGSAYAAEATRADDLAQPRLTVVTSLNMTLTDAHPQSSRPAAREALPRARAPLREAASAAALA